MREPLPSAPVGRSHLPQGDGSKGTAFSGGGKVSGIVQRRPLGGAGERSEPEGVLRLTGAAPHLAERIPNRPTQ